MLEVWGLEKDLNDLLNELIRGSSVIVSSDPEEPFVIIDRGSEGLAFLAPGPEESFSVISITLSMIASLETVLQESFRGYVGRNAILTIACGDPDHFYAHLWDVKRRGRRLYYGYEKAHYLLLVSRIYWCIENWGYVSMILRSFTRRYDRRTGLPVKQLRGFILERSEGGLKLEKVQLEDLIQAHTTDPKTGERLPPEPSIEYCYEQDCISSDEIR
jgi:hypothetical protein